MKITKNLLGRYGSVFLFVCMAALINCVDAADADKPLPPNVVARQGGAEVTLQDVDAAAAKIPEGDRAGFFDSPKRIETIVGGLLYQKQLAAKAREEKLEKNPLVQREIAQATDDVLGREETERYRKSLKLPDFELLAKEYYAGHKDEFMALGNIVVEHILVSTKDRPAAEAKARIAEVEAAARAHPDQFEALVEKYSDDQSKATNHGRIEHADSPRLAKPFSAAASALNTPGEISPIVKTDFGFHIIKLIEKTPNRQRSFDEVRVDLVLTLKHSYIDTQMDQYTGEFRGKPLQANPDLVASLRTRYASTPSDTASAPSTSEATTPAAPPAH